MIVALGLAVVLAVGVALVHPPATLAFPAIAIAHATLPVLAGLGPKPATSRIGPVVSLAGFVAASAGFLGWLAAGLLIDAPPAATSVGGAAVLSLGLPLLLLVALRRADTPFGESEGDR